MDGWDDRPGVVVGVAQGDIAALAVISPQFNIQCPPSSLRPPILFFPLELSPRPVSSTGPTLAMFHRFPPALNFICTQDGTTRGPPKVNKLLTVISVPLIFLGRIDHESALLEH